jgi:hypothetical protein
MVDNIAVTPGVGATVGANEIGGVLYQRTKVVWGAAGTVNDADVATGKPLPVQLRASNGVDISNVKYETVAASQTNQTMGGAGATGDFLAGVLVIPATTSPGAVSIKDGAGGAITIFTGGASSVSNLVPFFVTIGANSAAGAWAVTTGADVSAIGIGNFT